jgi:hypothetical protein
MYEPDPDHWPGDDWLFPRRAEVREPGPHDVAGERGGGRHRHGGPGRTLAPGLQWRKAVRSWALITGIVFFLIDTLLMAVGAARPLGTGSLVLAIIIWLISLAAVALLWVRASSRFSAR